VERHRRSVRYIRCQPTALWLTPAHRIAVVQ
jgi:hypothetical protein